MTARDLVCPKCHSAMEEGFMADAEYGGMSVARWIAGAPEKSAWTGVKVVGKRLGRVVTYCCVNCGYLESYAEPEFQERPPGGGLYVG